jgi:flotillin
VESTANIVSGMMKTVPPLNDLFNMVGLNLPTYLKGDDKRSDATAFVSTAAVEKKGDKKKEE